MDKKMMLGAVLLSILVCLFCAGCQSKQQAAELAIQKRNAALPHAQFMASFQRALTQHTQGRGMGGQPTPRPRMRPQTPAQGPSGAGVGSVTADANKTGAKSL